MAVRDSRQALLVGDEQRPRVSEKMPKISDGMFNSMAVSDTPCPESSKRLDIARGNLCAFLLGKIDRLCGVCRGRCRIPIVCLF